MIAANPLRRLYTKSHGVMVSELEVAPWASTEADRISIWKSVWRDLGFHSEEPRGSSRLLELALPLSTAGDGRPGEMLLGLFDVVGTNHIINSAYEYFLKQLWIVARCNQDRFGSVSGFLPVPQHITPRQAYLIARFIGGPDNYEPDAIVRIGRALEGQSLTELDPADYYYLG